MNGESEHEVTHPRTLGPRVAETAEALGAPLMPWQRHLVDVVLEADPETGLLARREVVVTVPRQAAAVVARQWRETLAALTPEDADDEPLSRLVRYYRAAADEATGERDRARATAVALEQEIGRVLEVLGDYNRPISLRVHEAEAILRGGER